MEAPTLSSADPLTRTKIPSVQNWNDGIFLPGTVVFVERSLKPRANWPRCEDTIVTPGQIGKP